MVRLKSLFAIYLVIFFGFVGYSLMITVFTPMLLGGDYSILSSPASLKERTVLLGLFLFLYPFGQFLSSPILGALSDRFGRRSILILSLFATTIAYAFIAIAIGIKSFYLLLTFLFFAGLFEGNVTIAQSVIADITTEKERGHYFGYIYLSASLAFVIGPLIGGKLSSSFSYATPFWFVALLLLLVAIWITFSFKETHPPVRRIKIKYLDAITNLKNVFLAKHLRFYYLVNFLLYIAIFGFFRSYPMYLVDEFDVGVSKLSEFIAWLSVPLIAVNFFLTGYLTKKVSPFTITLLSAFLIGITIEILIVPRSLNALWITLFLVGFFLALALPAAAMLLSNQATSIEQGSVIGNNQSLQFFAESFSGLVAGLIASFFVKLSLIVLGAVAILAGILLLFKIKKPHPKRKPTHHPPL